MLLEEAVTEKRDLIVQVMFVPCDLNAAAVLLRVYITVCLLLFVSMPCRIDCI